MSDRFVIRYRMDFSPKEHFTKQSDGINPRIEKKKDPIGDTIEMTGTVEEIKEKVCKSIDQAVKNLRAILFGDE